MNYKMIGRFFSQILFIESAFMLPAAVICLCDGDHASALSFFGVIAFALLAAAGFSLLTRGARTDFYTKEGLVCVGLAWVLLSLFGCLPFWLSGEIPSFIDAFFETVSGFTTTGASILKDVEALSRGMLYWRSFTHWLGGMGVLVFLLALIPVGGRQEGFTMHLLRAESPGPDVGKLVPKMRRTAMILYTTYIALTVLDFLFLVIGGMPVFDSVCTAFGTAGTGGFGIKNDSMASYSPYLQTVTTVFMLLFGVNFTCYYLLMIGQVSAALRDEELRVYAGTFAVATLLITLNVKELAGGFFPALHHAAFQVASIMTTTGFATTDFSLWPSFSKAILVLLMFTGAMAGSTGGGLKFARVLLLFKSAGRSIRKVLNPQSVRTVRVNRKAVEEKTVDGTATYFILYIGLLLGSFLLLSLDGFSFETNFTAALSCLNNIGPGLDAVGPAANYAGYGILSKLVLSFDMLAGRLELFPILVLFSAKAWKRA